MLAAIGGLDLTLTTNGSLLARKAAALAAAGLRRVTVSLDSLDDARLPSDERRRLPRRPSPRRDRGGGRGRPAREGRTASSSAASTTTGCVDLARYFHGSGHILRFIEYMDVGHTNGWRLDDVVPADEIVEQIDRELPLEPVEPAYRGEVARRWRYRDGAGEIGVIASVTQPFCGDCTRARLSADGKLYTCLFAQRGHDLRALLRSPAPPTPTSTDAIGEIWSGRTDRYSELRTAATSQLPKVEMSYVGG